jgi:hypothetical protein
MSEKISKPLTNSSQGIGNNIPLVTGPTFFKFFNESSGKYSSRVENNTAKIPLQYLNQLLGYLNSIIVSFSNSACLFCIIGQPFFLHLIDVLD